jgi:hypothetical protein
MPFEDLDDLLALLGPSPDLAIVDARFRGAVLEGSLVDERGTPPEMWQLCFELMSGIPWDLCPMVAMPSYFDQDRQEWERIFYMPRFRRAVWLHLFSDLALPTPAAVPGRVSEATPVSQQKKSAEEITKEISAWYRDQWVATATRLAIWSLNNMPSEEEEMDAARKKFPNVPKLRDHVRAARKQHAPTERRRAGPRRRRSRILA